MPSVEHRVESAVAEIKCFVKNMSFIRNIFHKMSAEEEEKDTELELCDDVSEETSTESSDTGIFTAVNSDLESSGHVDTDCAAISNFFGYWYAFFHSNISFLHARSLRKHSHCYCLLSFL